MTDDQRPQLPGGSAAWMRGMTSRRMSRRDMIRYAGISVGSLSLASILAACGGEEPPGSGGNTGTSAAGPTVDFTADPGDTVEFANWPLYIDKGRLPTGERGYPSLYQFEQDTSIKVNYNEEIQDNAAFFGELLPQLQAGQDTGRDIIVITNGRQLNALVVNGWVTELDPSRRPNFDANAAAWARDPSFDPGNRFTMAWQSGLTGLAWNTDMVAQPLTKMDDLMNADLVGTNAVGLFANEDLPNLVMINLGIDPEVSGPEEWQEAADWVQMLKESGTVRTFYDQGYIDDFVAGNTSACMAWSGDVLYYRIWEDYPFEFGVPDNGAVLWIDNMMIPANSANPQGAYQLMDYVYQPEIAQMITEWVLYMSPVPEVQQLIADHAEEESGGFAEDLRATAESEFLWPDDELLGKTSFGRNLTTDDEQEEWDSIFNPLFET
ncbi:MAG TPA: spermidine/putrescine ABC transporter substrate-binding protein [Actinomycetota bacterium]|nr:spermidine/putrescine ABC transporter substrate-binding protein [Actinomycetota bacterium]